MEVNELIITELWLPPFTPDQDKHTNSDYESLTWSQKKEPSIPSLRQVGHWSLASLSQPEVSQILTGPAVAAILHFSLNIAHKKLPRRQIKASTL